MCWILHSFPGFPTKVWGKRDSKYPVGATKQYQKRDICGQKGDTESIIVGDNLAGHCFLLREDILCYYCVIFEVMIV